MPDMTTPREIHDYYKKLAFPLLWEALFVVSYILFPAYSLYLQLAFYAGIIFWFRRDFSFRELSENAIKGGVRFWGPVVITAAAMWAVFRLVNTMEALLIPFLDDGMIQIRVMSSFTTFESILNILLYAAAMILLPPLAEGLFFRKAVICSPELDIMPFTVLIGLFLCAVSHALDWPGIIEMFLIALPVTICYVLTRNIYISIAAHFLFQLVTNVYYVGYAIARILTR